MNKKKLNFKGEAGNTWIILGIYLLLWDWRKKRSK
jgi:hypothetical protein